MNKELLKETIKTVIENFKTAIQQHGDINIKRADGGWSVGEIANHIVKGIQTSLGASKITERPYDQNAAAIKNLFLNFEMKFPAAPFLQPESKQYNTEELFSTLDRSKENILKMINEENLTETCTDIQLPVWGSLTKYEWLVLFENHIIRHTKQVNDFNNVIA
jgi:uncharacterized damage-inducible protein DinB